MLPTIEAWPWIFIVSATMSQIVLIQSVSQSNRVVVVTEERPKEFLVDFLLDQMVVASLLLRCIALLLRHPPPSAALPFLCSPPPH